jgi:hypothetical protein
MYILVDKKRTKRMKFNLIKNIDNNWHYFKEENV